MAKSRITTTQRFFLTTAARQERGLIRVGPGDRKGTRIARYDAAGVPVIIAYQTPEWFLLARKMLTPYGNERGVYQITDAGRAAISEEPSHD